MKYFPVYSLYAFLALVVLLCSNGPINARDLTVIARELDAIILAQMQKRGIPGLQITLFSPTAFLERSYGHADAKKKHRIVKNTLFQAGSLVRPLTAYTILSVLLKQSDDQGQALRAPIANQGPEGYSFINPTGRAVNVHHLLTMTSGLPVARIGVVPKGRRQASRKELLQNVLQIGSEPGMQIQMAPQGYAYLAELVQAVARQRFTALAQAELKKMGLDDSSICIRLKDCAASSVLSAALTSVSTVRSSRTTYFNMPEVEFLFPAADSLFTTSGEYARFFVWLGKRARQEPASLAGLLFRQHFRYDQDLGGTSYGFLFSLPVWYKKQSNFKAKESTVFYIENSLPGYSSLAFTNAAGYGAVILVNKDDLFFVRSVQRRLYRAYKIMNPETDYPKIALSAKEKEELQGAYRPLSDLPGAQAWLNFLNELQLRPTSQAIELSSVFEKEVFVRLYPLKKDLYLIRGLVQMDGWRLLLRRDAQGKLIGFDTDLMRYERVPGLFSARSILIALGLLAGSPVFAALFYFILRKRPVQS